jgi:CBS domain-containing protein
LGLSKASRIEAEVPPTVSVRDRMSSGVHPIAPDASLVEAARQMRVSGVGGLPVQEPDGTIIGIVTERDIIVRALAEGLDARAGRVRDVATLEPVTCAPDEEIGVALARMSKHDVHRLPVVEDGGLVGVVSVADIVFEHPDEERGSVDVGSRAI